MITSPTPTQQPPEQPEADKRVVRSTLIRRRAGQTPVALFVKAILRPIFKGIYYLLSFMRSHKLVSLLAIVLILGSASAVSYVETGQWPLGIANDQFNFHIHGTNGGGDQVRNWLYALRDGDATAISILDRFISQPPDPAQLVSQLSQSQAHLTWKNITVVGVYQESDQTIDSFVEVDLSTNGPAGGTSAFAIFHFVTVAQQGGAIIDVQVEQNRASQS